MVKLRLKRAWLDATWRGDSLGIFRVLLLHTSLHTHRLDCIAGDQVALARTNVTLPQELLDQVDELAGPRGRSKFVADAVETKVKRERLRMAIAATRGALVGTPSYMGPGEAYRWIRSMREEDGDA